MKWYFLLFLLVGVVSKIDAGWWNSSKVTIVCSNGSNTICAGGKITINGITVTNSSENQVIGSGVPVKRTVDLSMHKKQIKKLIVGGIASVKFVQGNEDSVVIEADDNIQEYLQADVHNNSLEIGLCGNGSLRINTPIVYYISLKSLEKITLSGSVAFYGSGITSEELQLKLSGSTNFNSAVQTKQLSIKMSGSSRIKVSGETQHQSLKMSGSSRYDGERLKSKEGAVSASGASEVMIAVEDVLHIDVSGVVSVRYLGSPVLRVSKSGCASVKKG